MRADGWAKHRAMIAAGGVAALAAVLGAVSLRRETGAPTGREATCPGSSPGEGTSAPDTGRLWKELAVLRKELRDKTDSPPSPEMTAVLNGIQRKQVQDLVISELELMDTRREAQVEENKSREIKDACEKYATTLERSLQRQEAYPAEFLAWLGLNDDQQREASRIDAEYRRKIVAFWKSRVPGRPMTGFDEWLVEGAGSEDWKGIEAERRQRLSTVLMPEQLRRYCNPLTFMKWNEMRIAQRLKPARQPE